MERFYIAFVQVSVRGCVHRLHCEQSGRSRCIFPEEVNDTISIIIARVHIVIVAVNS